MPVDVELFSLTAGGIPEPKAEWTANAQKHMDKALRQQLSELRLDFITLDEKAADE